MEFNEALRRTFAGHWRLLVCFVAVPLLVVAVMHALSSPSYVATGRIQASSTPPGTDTEADAVLNRVAGIATSPAVINDALRQAGITTRDANQLAGGDVAVGRLGSSAVFNVSVTDPSPQIATGLAGALATQVVTFINGAGDPRTTALVTQLTSQQQNLLAQRQQVAAKLALASGPLDTANLSAQLSTLDQQLNDLGSTLRQLQSTVLSTGGSAAVISMPPPATQAPSKLATDLGLAGLAGLIAGLLVATVLEVVRPRVAGAREFARELGTVDLGRLTPAPDGGDAVTIDVATTVALRETVTRTGTGTMVVTGPLPAPRLSALAEELANRLSPGHGTGGAPSADGVSARPAGFADPGRTATLDPVMELLPQHEAVEVRALPDVDTTSGNGRRGLLVVAPDLTLHREVDDIRTLIAATGWPVLGVLGMRALRRRESSREGGPA
ncbi:hypothetical protein [Amycolatopsis pithecellobii]|uniref:Exopolysaccharide biosynthesis protein n=1 Tax=Amycolatopsis pithecellobii TaxID=664692 RepID=A0A6N7Z4D5_9PSEU|nr:hypothetical protein [Amycolatopsis pithecellobii]MTD55140.1 hypothetical protein [Amycolatopsis pithecellobii]